MSPFSDFTDPGEWLELYADLPDDLPGLMRVVKNLLVHPFDRKKYGLRATPNRQRELQKLFTVQKMLGDLFRHPPVSLVEVRSPYQRLLQHCDFHTVLLASFCQYKGVEVRTRCGFAAYLAPGMWLYHWLNEVRRPFFDTWTLVDADRQCWPRREAFRPGATWWRDRHARGIQRLSAQSPANRYEGVTAVQYALLNDFNALNGRELLHYQWLDPDSPGQMPAIYRLPYTQLDQAQKQQLESIAAAILDEDENRLAALFHADYYQGDETAA